MQSMFLNRNERRALVALALASFLVPNGIFIYCAVKDFGLIVAAMQNPVSLVFILEAFVLMFLAAWFIQKIGTTKIKAAPFVVLSLMGSLGFSAPLTIYLESKNSK